MRQFDEFNEKSRFETIKASLMMLCFGLGILAFLIVIERPEWFHIRPVSGAAAAMVEAGNSPDGTEALP